MTIITKIKSELGWSSKTSLDKGLDITINWIKKYEDRI